MDTPFDPEAAARIDRYWAETLGCMPGDLREAGLTLASKPEDGPPGIAVFDRGDSRVVSAPAERLEALEERRSDLAESDPVAGGYADLLGAPNATRLGPQYILYATVDTFRPVHDANTRPIERPAADALAELRKACGEEEWEERADDIGFDSHDTLVGRFVGDDLGAVAAYRSVTDHLARVATITHPEHRNRGFGTAAASGAVTEALADGYVADCRPVAAWETAVDIADFLGFERYGTAWRLIVG